MAEQTGPTLRGALELQVDEQGLEAVLVFTPDPGGPEWTSAKVEDLLQQEGVAEGREAKALEVLFQGEAGSRGRTVVVARGTPPEAGVPAELAVGRLAVPEALKPYEERVIPAGMRPSVSLKTVAKTKIEQTVEKKPLLPFLRARKQKQVVWEKSESVRTLEQAGEELGRGYAHKGDVVGTVTPGRRARAGRSVFGREIPVAAQEEEEGVYLAGALRQVGAEIRAEEAGFYRYGAHWIEQFPFLPHEHRVHASQNRLTCLLDFIPGSDQADPPTAEGLLEEAEELGFAAAELLSVDEIALLLSQALTDRAAIEAASLSRPVDAAIRIDVAEDALSARLLLQKSRGAGKPLDLKEVGDAIRTRKLRGMNVPRVREDVLSFYRGTTASLEDYVLVEGREAQTGEDGRIEWKLTFLHAEQTREIEAQAAGRPEQLASIKSLEAFPLEAVGQVAVVQERQTVAGLHPATAGQAGVDVFGRLRPGVKGKEIRVELFENLQTVRNEIVTLSRGLLEKGRGEDPVRLRVRVHRDREIQASVSKDGMEGSLTLLPPEGSGKPLDPQEVESALSTAGVVRGFLDGAVSEAVARARGGRKVEHQLIARGQDPVHGQDTELVILVQQASGRRVALGEDGRADYRRQDKITTVQAGTLLARLEAPTPGIDGWQVTGKEIPARKGAARYIQVGKNVECREAEDGTLEYLARIEGELDYRGGSIDVLQVHTVETNVGMGSGNVRFPGSVRVLGSVDSGFSVISDESIFVEESVHGALLSAGEAIGVEKGIVGEGKAVLRAKKSIRARFAEQATLLAVENIRLSSACLRCTVKCNGKMILESEKGNIVGGRVYCKLGVEAMNLGSDRGVRTEIHFGQDILVQDNLEREQAKLAKLKSRNVEIGRALIRAERTAPDDLHSLEALRVEKRRNLQLIQMYFKRVFILQERFEQHFPSEIVVRGVVYPGVVLHSHGRQRELKTPLREVVFYFNTTTGRIDEKALGS